MTHPTQDDDVKVNDIPCLRINYDVEGWRKLTKGFTLPTVLPGAILAIDSLCDEVEQLRARLEQAERDSARYRWLRDGQESDWAICEWANDHDGTGFYRDARNAEIVEAAIDAAMASEKAS